MKKYWALLLMFISLEPFGIACANDQSLNYEGYMRTLVSHAQKYNPEFPFAAMIIDSKGKELCLGINHSNDNPTFHGEIDAINQCIKQYGNSLDWSKLTLITTAEPCPMCQGAIIWSNFHRVVYGTSIDTLVKKGWHQIMIDSKTLTQSSNFNKPEIIGDVLSEETDKLFRNYHHNP